MNGNGAKRHFDIAIIGGGFAGVYCAKRLLKRLGHLHKKIGIIAEENHMVFQPMLPEVVGGSLSPRHVVNPIRLLCKGADVLKGEVRSVDLNRRVLQLDGGYFSPNVEITFDHLVLAVGAHVDLSRIPGMAEHAYLMRNAGDAMKLRAAIISRMEEANLLENEEERRRLLSFVVVGGGYSGVETAGEIVDLLRGVCRYYDQVGDSEPTVTLIHARDRLLPTLDESLGDYTRRQLEKAGVKLVLNQRVRAVTARSVLLDNGEKVEATSVVCTVGNAPHPLIVEMGERHGLPLERGKVIVENTGRVSAQKNVWALGDCSMFPKLAGGKCPETAQFALQQGIRVGENIAAAILERPLEPFAYSGLGEMAVIGHRKAVGSIMGINFSGFIAWFMWRTVYLGKLPGLDRKLRVMAEWSFDLFFPRDINLLTPRYSSPLEEMYLEAGDPLFQAGEPAFSLYAVKSGRVDIIDKKGEIIKSAGEGEYFGERALLENRIWNFDAVAREPSILVAIDARTFEKLVGSMDLLQRMFRRSAAQYAMPEEVGRAVSSLPPSMRERKAADVMTSDVATLKSDATIDDALAMFQKHHHSVYPVVDDNGTVLGAVRRAPLYDWLAHHRLERNHKISEMPAGPLLRVHAEDSVSTVLENLIRSGATKAAVVDSEQKLQGIIALYDLLEARKGN